MCCGIEIKVVSLRPIMSTVDQKRQKETLRNRGICVVIPTYNNVGTICRVVEETLAECDDVIVVNDGSTDTTASILNAQCTMHNAQCTMHNSNTRKE